jgi:hypothetical protein
MGNFSKMNLKFFMGFNLLPALLGFMYTISNIFLEVPEWFFKHNINSYRLALIILAVVFVLNFSAKTLLGQEGIAKNRKFLSVSIFCFLGGWLLGFNSGFDSREFADEHGLNIIYSFLNLFVIILTFANYKSQNQTAIMCFIFGTLMGINGSKASLLTFVMFFIVFYKTLSLKDWFLLTTVPILIGILFPKFLIRYLDQGLSMITIAGICDDTGIAPFNLYLEAIQSKLAGVSFNPAKEFLNRTGISEGYNITPTVFGDIYCGGSTWLLYFAAYLTIVLVIGILPCKFFKYKIHENRLCLFVIFTGVNSTIFDAMKFLVLVHCAVFGFKFFKFVTANHSQKEKYV